MKKYLLPPLCFALLFCLVSLPAWSASAPSAKHVYLLDVVHGSPEKDTDAMLKAKGFTELRKNGSPDPAIYNMVYGGKMEGADAEVEVSYYNGITLGLYVSLAAKTPAQKKAAEAVFQKTLSAWTKAYGKPDEPLRDMFAWLLDNMRVSLNLAMPEPKSENPAYLLSANRPYLD